MILMAANPDELCSRCGKPEQPKFHRRGENAPQPWRFCSCRDGGYFPVRDVITDEEALICDTCGERPFWSFPRVGDPCPDDAGHLVTEGYWIGRAIQHAHQNSTAIRLIVRTRLYSRSQARDARLLSDRLAARVHNLQERDAPAPSRSLNSRKAA